MFQAGDHVCIGRGIAGAVKHHAIVVQAQEKDGWMEIIEYGVYNEDGSKKLVAGHALDMAKEQGDVRRCRVNAKKESWKLVNHKGESGIQSNEKVVQAAIFLLNNKNLLPKYHMTFSNGECAARWCKQGMFTSDQASNLYDKISKATKAKAAVGAATKKSSTKMSTVVVAASALVGKRQDQVSNSWVKTKQTLDQAFSVYVSAK